MAMESNTDGVLKRLGLASDENGGKGKVSASDVLAYLLNEKILEENAVQSAVKALSKKKSNGKPVQKSKDPENPPAVRTRHVALKFLYDGANFSGLAQNLGQDSDNSVERALFQALKKAKLVESRETSGYSRCGRTDRGVSAAGQVVALRLKSAIPLDASSDREGQQLLEESQLPKNENERISAWVIPRKQKANSDTQVKIQKKISEYPYAKILNNLLPREIRIQGWAPVSDEFSARFSATTRMYRYFFVRRQLNLQRMQEGLELLVGKHDFRNFCKMDVEKVYNFERVIHDAKLVVGNDPKLGVESEQVCHVEILGQAFLWHQIRCIMEILFMIGNELDEPSIISELFDVEKYPGKPAYPLAAEQPLVLNECGYPNLQFGYSVQNIWTVSCQLEQQWDSLVLAAARLRNAILAFRDVSISKDDLLEFASSKVTERKKKLQRAGITSSSDAIDETKLSESLPNDAMLTWSFALDWLEKQCALIPDAKGLNTTIHVPLLNRSRGTTYEQKVEAVKKSDKRRLKYEENVIKKRKTAEEDAEFYNHKTQQGGSGI